MPAVTAKMYGLPSCSRVPVGNVSATWKPGHWDVKVRSGYSAYLEGLLLHAFIHVEESLLGLFTAYLEERDAVDGLGHGERLA